jgi:transposase-like protein
MAAGQRERVAVLLAGGYSVARAARECSVSERAVFKWLRSPEFAKRVEDLQVSLLEKVMARMIRDTVLAERELRKLLKDPNSKVRLGACVAVQDRALKLHDHVALSRRIAVLEATEAARAKKGRR